ncbi:tetratricopeptide repeat-containing sensor histidine kinase [Indibacter alkaliphilus]|uniref:tetratricopeptide repeat-containing sensor histidine kinase n=1 Tax=Indibacter alkaliphilus TaxID=579922 RepID=UPI000282420F|nr:tetratricopeptide repeat-containing sensor histidine kinase [Indibacter alkaliphilus]
MLKTRTILICTFFFTLLEAFAFQQDEDFDFLMEQALKYRYDNLDSAFYFISRLEDYLEKSPDPIKKTEVLYRKGGIYYVSGDYINAQSVYNEAHDLALQSGDSLSIAKVQNGKGLILLGQEKYIEAIDVWKQALPVFKKAGDKSMEGNLSFNIGLAYSQIFEYSKSLEFLHEAYKLLEVSGNLALKDMTINRLGKVYFDIGNDEKAMLYYGMLLSREYELSNWEKTFLYAGLAELELKAGNDAKAAAFSEKSYGFAKDLKALWDMERATNIWSRALENLQDYRQALNIARMNKSYADSLLNIEKERGISFLQLQVKDAENKQLLNQNELIQQKSQQRRALNLILILLSIFLGVLVFNYRKNLKLRDRFNQKLEKLNKELNEKRKLIAAQNESLNQINEAKNKLFSILSHDLRSPIGNLKSFVMLDKKGVFNQDEKTQALNLLEEQLNKTDNLLENLLDWAKSQLEGFNTKQEVLSVKEIMEEALVQYEFQISNKQLNIQHIGPDPTLKYVIADRSHLQMIFQNIISNAIKFSPKSGKLSIFYSESAEFARIHIKDSGQGMEAEDRERLENDFSMVKSQKGTLGEKGTGLGLLLVKQLLVYNGGFLKVKSKAGYGTEMIVHLKRNTVELSEN